MLNSYFNGIVFHIWSCCVIICFKEHLFIIINFSAAEYETRKREKSGGGGGGDKTEQSWEWGKLPKSADHSDKDDTDGKDKVLNTFRNEIILRVVLSFKFEPQLRMQRDDS